MNREQRALSQLKGILIGFRKAIVVTMSLLVVIALFCLLSILLGLEFFPGNSEPYKRTVEIAMSAISGSLVIPAVVFMYRTSYSIIVYDHAIEIAGENPSDPRVMNLINNNPIVFSLK